MASIGLEPFPRLLTMMVILEAVLTSVFGNSSQLPEMSGLTVPVDASCS
jgi:hypothetical protein